MFHLKQWAAHHSNVITKYKLLCQHHKMPMPSSEIFLALSLSFLYYLLLEYKVYNICQVVWSAHMILCHNRLRPKTWLGEQEVKDVDRYMVRNWRLGNPPIRRNGVGQKNFLLIRGIDSKQWCFYKVCLLQGQYFKIHPCNLIPIL